jgi:hypothetical protein
MVLKSEVVDKLKEFFAEMRVAGLSVKVFITDNGTEFTCAEVQKVLGGIEHRLTMPYSAEEKCCAERENRTLSEAARSMLAAKELPKNLWAVAILTASYVLNRTCKSSVKGKTPFELWYGRNGAIDHLRIFGTECFMHVPKVKRQKWDPKSIKWLIVGYSGDRDGYRTWVPGTKIVYQSHDVKFKDEEVVTSTAELAMLDHEPRVIKRDEADGEKNNSSMADDDCQSLPEPSSGGGQLTVSAPKIGCLRNRDSLRKPAWLESYVTAAVTGEVVSAVTDVPITYHETLLSKDRRK